jgi:hypothetical protein
MVLLLSRSSNWVAVKTYSGALMVDDGRICDGEEDQRGSGLKWVLSRNRENVRVKAALGPALAQAEEKEERKYSSHSCIVG